MINRFETIKKNVKSLKNARNIHVNMVMGEIEEAAFMMKGNVLSYTEAAKLFSSIFEYPLLSSEYMFFCHQLAICNCFLESKTDEVINSSCVSLMDNLYSKEAFQNFSKYFLISTDFDNSFTALCEAVYSHRTKYAILPLSNTLDGIITSIYRLIQKYELRIAASTKVLTSNGENETEFVLVTNSRTESESCSRLMVSITHKYGENIVELLSALKSIGIVPLSIDTLPLSYTDERCESLINFDISTCVIKAVSCFLKTALPQANIVGMYSIVK